MTKENYFNIIDFGSSKIRFSIFDDASHIKFNETILINNNDSSINNFINIQNLIKNGEKKILNHINNIILLIDTPDLLSIDLTLKKKLENKIDIEKIYLLIYLELKQLINSNYTNFEIIHIINDNCEIDGKLYSEIPKSKMKSKNLKVDFKIICFPKKIISNLNNQFNKININITNIFCTSFIKSQNYSKKIGGGKTSFLEIGWERTTLVNFKNNKLQTIQSIPVGGFHITKDISKVFKISLDEAEKIKKIFSKSETEFSYYSNTNNDSLSIKEILDKNISIDLLKKVILYRIQEIIDLIFKKSFGNPNNSNHKNSNFFLIGEGSNLFNNNSFHLNNEFMFDSINFYKETDVDICYSCLVYHLNNVEIRKITSKKQGFFEKFFNVFNK